MAMKTHITGSGVSNRRAKGKNSKPLIYLMVEIFILMVAVFLISLAKITALTIVSVLAAVFFFVISCLPRFRRVRARQTEKHTHNNIHN